MPLRTLQDLIDQLARDGAVPALIAHQADGAATWTRQELGERVLRLASGLAATGVGEGAVVGLLAPNEPAWIEAFLAIVRTGALAMPLPEQTTAEELLRIVPHSGCRHVLTTSKYLRRLARLEERSDLEVVLLDEGEVGEQLRRRWRIRRIGELRTGAPQELADLRPEQLAVLLYTSGTTGTPKGVPLSHGNLCSNVEALIAAQLAGPADRVLLPLPLHHTYPLTVGLLGSLATRAAIVLPAGITGPQITRALKDCGCTIMVAVPRLYEAMLQGIEGRLTGSRLVAPVYRRALQLSLWVRRRWNRRIGRLLFRPLHRRVGRSLRLLASGGARLDPDVAWRLEGLGWQVLTGYGLTETSPIVTFNRPGRARLESAGQPVEGVELRVDPQEEADPGHGEIQVRGPNVFKGYWENPEATAEAFTGDGFFRTGDLGYLDDESYLYIVGRSKELIVLAGGKNIFPDEVEAVYGQSGIVREVAVLEHEGRLVGLFVPEPEALRRQAADEVRRVIREEIERRSPQLPPYARIGDFAITTQSLPRTQIGKLRRHELPEIFAREKAGRGRPEPSPARSEEDEALLATPPADRIWPWLTERFSGHTLTLDTSPQLDLGLDSFDWMSLAMELEERFCVRLSEDALARITSLRALLEEAAQTAPAGETAAEVGRLSPEQQRWLEPPGMAARALGSVIFALARLLMRTLFRLRVEGARHLPQEGRLLITPSHGSYLDPFALAAALPRRLLERTYWAGWTGLLFRGPLTRLFSRAAHVVPVDPERGITSTLALGRAVLERDLNLVWFPEGQRSADGRLQRFLPGAGWLLDKTGATAVPVLIEGAHEAWPPQRLLPRPGRITVRFGPPRPLDELAAGAEGEDRHARIAENLRAAVAGLAGSETTQAQAAA